MEATDKKSAKGIKMPCICCGEAKAEIQMNLAKPGDFTCVDCGAEFTRSEIEAAFAKWRAMFEWIDTMPASV